VPPNWASLPADLELLIGHSLADRYLVEDVLGVGGMGAVFRGRHLALERDVAIKVLKPEYAHHEEVSARFNREAKAASLFDHPNCVRVIDFGTTREGMKFMVMQLLEGRGLVALLGQRFPASQAIAIALQILRGLEHAHNHGVIHRDLKPENVFITRDHAGEIQLKLVDFGIAKLTDGRRDGIVTRIGTVFGTPQYMSPEQASGEDIDERADLYSVGVILYQLLTARLPFDDPDTRELMRKQIIAQPPPLPRFVPSALVTPMGKLLAKRRDLRYASATDAIAALEAALRQLPDDRIPPVDLLGALQSAPRGYGRDQMPMPEGDEPLQKVDRALQQVLTNKTPFALEALQDGIRQTPVKRNWNIDIENLELDEIDGDGRDDG
jgi:eukaryotic-like serine/threonine-protein kinase